MNTRMHAEQGEKVVILGGGLTGISAAMHLGAPWVLLEKNDRLGGHARTDEREGYWFDKTGHWLHLRDPYTQKLIADVPQTGARWSRCCARYVLHSMRPALRSILQARLTFCKLQTARSSLRQARRSSSKPQRGARNTEER
jgi:phytoene dehydrogenase-like protein